MQTRIRTTLALLLPAVLLLGAAAITAAEDPPKEPGEKPAGASPQPPPPSGPPAAQTPPAPKPADGKGRVWTNEDLKKLPQGGLSVLGGGSSDAPPPATADRGEYWWRTQYELLQGRLVEYARGIQDAKTQLGLAANPLTRPVARREGGKPPDPAVLQQQVADMEKGLEATRKALTDLDEAARKAAIPRAWKEPARPERAPVPPAPEPEPVQPAPQG